MMTLSRTLALLALVVSGCASESAISSLSTAAAVLLRDGVDNDADGEIDETDEAALADTGGDDMADGCAPGGEGRGEGEARPEGRGGRHDEDTDGPPADTDDTDRPHRR